MLNPTCGGATTVFATQNPQSLHSNLDDRKVAKAYQKRNRQETRGSPCEGYMKKIFPEFSTCKTKLITLEGNAFEFNVHFKMPTFLQKFEKVKLELDKQLYYIHFIQSIQFIYQSNW